LLKALDSPFFNEAKAALIKKWMTFAKSSHIDKVMAWRLIYLYAKFTPAENTMLKTKLSILRYNEVLGKNLQKVQLPCGISIRVHIAKKIDTIFSLLDPDLPFE
jgi:hypothetical protein